MAGKGELEVQRSATVAVPPQAVQEVAAAAQTIRFGHLLGISG